jgi:hypothetical protein
MRAEQAKAAFADDREQRTSHRSRTAEDDASDFETRRDERDDLLLGRQAQLLRMRATVMIGQDLARLSGLVCHRPLADLTAHNWQMGNGYGEATGSS